MLLRVGRVLCFDASLFFSRQGRTHKLNAPIHTQNRVRWPSSTRQPASLLLAFEKNHATKTKTAPSLPLLSSHKSNRPPHLPQLLHTLRADGGRTTVRLMNAVVDACRKGQQWEKALEMLDDMRRQGLTPDDFTYTAAIAACRQGRQWDKVCVISVVLSNSVHLIRRVDGMLGGLVCHGGHVWALLPPTPAGEREVQLFALFNVKLLRQPFSIVL